MEWTKEEIQKQLRKNQEEMQERFMSDLLEKVQFLSEKANHKDYVPTLKERVDFGQIVTIIKHMVDWF